MPSLRRTATLALATLATVSVLGTGGAVLAAQRSPAVTPTGPTASQSPERETPPRTTPTAPTEPREAPVTPTAPAVPEQPAVQPPADPPAAPLRPGPALLAPGDQGPEVRELQARLRQIDWFNTDVTGTYGDITHTAVEGFQAKREIPVTGDVDERTLDRLLAMTSEPTAAELANELGENTAGALDPRCVTGRVLCVDKTSRTVRWVVDGEVRTTVDARFGSEALPTREGTFVVERKSRDHVSSLYGSSMPFAMFFSRGQAVHYSPDFASVGYNGASHGCVNVRDYDAIAALYDQVDVGDAVIVYRS